MLMRWVPVSNYIWGEFRYFLSKQDKNQQCFNRYKMLKCGQKNENLYSCWRFLFWKQMFGRKIQKSFNSC